MRNDIPHTVVSRDKSIETMLDMLEDKKLIELIMSREHELANVIEVHLDDL
jgi:hypothetical protein